MLPSLTTVSDWASSAGYEPAGVAPFLQVADYYLVAQAQAHGYTVVTHEVFSPVPEEDQDPERPHRRRSQVRQSLRDAAIRAGPVHSRPLQIGSGLGPSSLPPSRFAAVARSDHVKALLRSHQRGDEAGFQRAAKDLIDDERRKRHDLVAEQLEAILEEPGRTAEAVAGLVAAALFPRRRDDLTLISLEEPSLSFQDLVLSETCSRGLRLAGGGVPSAFGSAGSRRRAKIEPPAGGPARLRAGRATSQPGCRSKMRLARPLG